MSILSDINTILFTNDPMKTGCVENELHDEYMEEAVAINHLIDMDATEIEIEVVVKTVFDKFFWDNCLDEETTAELSKEIRGILMTA